MISRAILLHFPVITDIIKPMNTVTIFPVITGLLLILFFAYYIKVVQPRTGTVQWISDVMGKGELSLINKRFPMEIKDFLPLAIITSAFLILAVVNLGNTDTVDVIREIHEPSANRTRMSNLYFDEIYFVRTAAEHIQSLHPYESSHPPLGKEIIAASILIAGESPFGWRLLGAVFGVITIVVMYIFAKNMFGKTLVAAGAALLSGFDFMRFVQTRLATIDSYAVLFILLAFFFMYRYITVDADAPFRKSVAPLALSGIFFGLSFAVKWVGFYAGAGLLVIYIIRLYQLIVHYNEQKKSGFGIYLTKTLLFSMLFFVIIPVLVYYLSYIPYGAARGMTLEQGMLWNPEFFDIVWKNQVSMFSYHSKLVAEHPFSSTWWQWILNIRPILYVNSASGELRSTFGSFGNPVVWWAGFVAIVIMAVRVFTHNDGKAWFILIGYALQLLPWVAVTRIVFIYHYFPSSLFMILALAHIFNTMIERGEQLGKQMVYGFTALTGIIFAMFYPAISGMYMPRWYYSNLIKWFDSWPF